MSLDVTLTIPRPGTVVRLELWGYTDQDLEWATTDARFSCTYLELRIAETRQTVGQSCPINRDGGEIARGEADFGRAWAAYPVAAAGDSRIGSDQEAGAVPWAPRRDGADEGRDHVHTAGVSAP